VPFPGKFVRDGALSVMENYMARIVSNQLTGAAGTALRPFRYGPAFVARARATARGFG
jgi:hypothetical protein